MITLKLYHRCSDIYNNFNISNINIIITIITVILIMLHNYSQWRIWPRMGEIWTKFRL